MMFLLTVSIEDPDDCVVNFFIQLMCVCEVTNLPFLVTLAKVREE